MLREATEADKVNKFKVYIRKKAILLLKSRIKAIN